MSMKADLPPQGMVEFRVLGHTFRFSRFTFLLFLGALVGALTAIVAVIFRLAAHWGQAFFFPIDGAGSGLVSLTSWAALRRVAMPALGGLVCGFLLYKISDFQYAHSIPTILRAVASGQSFFKSSMAYPPALASITIATGGSAGPEGPIAEIGSVMGSQIGRIAGLSPRMVKPLIGAGVAAGIAAVFNTPFGGVFFAIEVILRNYEVASFTPILIAAVVASVISQAILGSGTAITMPEIMDIPGGELWLFAVLGILCGFVSIFFVHGLGFCHDLFRKQERIPRWLRPAVGGLGVGLIGLGAPQVMGEGYDWMRDVIAGNSEISRLVWLLVLLVVLKTVATGLTIGSGSPGGSFAPAVFVGIMTGAAFGLVMHKLGWCASPTPYAVMGMAGLIAAALGAPITAIIITLHYSRSEPMLLLPVMTTVAMATGVMQLRRNLSVYTMEFLRLGIDFDKARASDPLSLVRVSAALRDEDLPCLPASMPVRQALIRIKDGVSRWFVVRGEGDAFVGIVSLHDMRMAIAEEELSDLLVLGDITDALQPRLHAEMSLKEALTSFSIADAEVLPVFSEPGDGARFLGVISRQDALDVYTDSTGALD